MKIKCFLTALVSLVLLCSCATTDSMPDAPCDNFGQHCNPKMPINHR